MDTYREREQDKDRERERTFANANIVWLKVESHQRDNKQTNK